MFTATLVGWLVAVVACWRLVKAWRRESVLERDLHDARIRLGLAPAMLSLPAFSDDDGETYREWAGLTGSKMSVGSAAGSADQ